MQLVVQRPDAVPRGDRLRDVGQAARAVAELEPLRQEHCQLVAGDAADSGAEDRHEPAGREGTNHLVVVILERGRSDANEGTLLAEDGAVERLELRARLDAQVFDQRASRLVVCRQRLGLPARAIERQHQVRPQALAERVQADERFDLGHELRVRAGLEVRSDPVFERSEAKILEATDLVLRECLQLHVGQGSAAPECESLPQEQRAVPTPRQRRARSGRAARSAPDRAGLGRSRADTRSAACAGALAPAASASAAARRCSGAMSSPSAAGARPRAGRRDVLPKPLRSRAGAARSEARAGCGRPAAPVRPRREPPGVREP